jgi:hypothetical protein
LGGAIRNAAAPWTDRRTESASGAFPTGVSASMIDAGQIGRPDARTF